MTNNVTKGDDKKVRGKFLTFFFGIIRFFLKLILICIIGTVAVNVCMVLIEQKKELSVSEASCLTEVDCIYVLGCSVQKGKPSYLLKDRLDKAIEVYNAYEIKPVIVVSGDHKTRYYNEVKAMKEYLVENGIPSEKIFLDHAGYNTYDSFYRARHSFGIKRLVIVTQKYHMSRSIYIARCFGMDAYGVCAEDVKYDNQFWRDEREILARNKDFLWCLFKPESEVSGDKYDLSGNGDDTNEKVVQETK